VGQSKDGGTGRRRAITEDDWFHKSLYNTFWLALVAGVPQHLVALPLAFFFQTALGRWRNAVVAMYFGSICVSRRSSGDPWERISATHY
jgi:ABC-type spermidine/putrescine transport system permease subunit I